ncbi:ketopantoate reductase family protein [Bacillus sp. T33-2]|uniref:ketopantoate reductase family protein n=1 Tax=Bacillus sp. T33-2 TaxID=2054168 RepID=UPI000C768AF7|nr:ketopantoate reductase family protein [Bacillus sp. T33-2]PLR95387.1 2-dehydropantoate 2-reductase [Bacillus sp. T33-2]
MRTLVVGAGAVGGYFGGRLLEKEEDVTFLVRERRKQQLEITGLTIESVHGNLVCQPKTILAGQEAGPFDVILLSTKAYHLDGAIESIRQYVTGDTVILPLLNGIVHIGKLAAEFGQDKVIGGLCFIESTLDSQGVIIQTSPVHDLIFGERNGKKTARIKKIQAAFSGTKANFRLSDNINQDMWHKYMFIAALSGITTLMRAPVGPIRSEPSGRNTIQRLLSEINEVMKRNNAPVAEGIVQAQMVKIEEMGYAMKSSMQRDMEKGFPTEADHLQGYLLETARKENLSVPVLEAIYANLKVYESQLNK